MLHKARKSDLGVICGIKADKCRACVVLGGHLGSTCFYNLGTKAIDILTANAKEFTRAASMLGVFIVGALTSNYGGTTVATVIENGDSPIVIQSILDGVLPKLIPLALTLGLFFLMKKKNWKPVTCIALLLVIGLVGAFFGIFA